MKVLITGGGTGGHINPALAIASIIKKNDKDAKFLFAGTPFGMEAKLIPLAGYDFEPIKVRGFQRKFSINNIKRNAEAFKYLLTSKKRAKEIIANFKPDIVIGTGGYVSGPVVHQATKMKIPTVIHEQNAYPGMTTKILSKKVDKVMITFKESLSYLGENISYKLTGLPVRTEIFKNNKEEARKILGFDDSFCILSFGGSLGSGCINETMAELINWHTKNNLKINHIHGYGGMGKDFFPKKMKEYDIPLKSSRLRVTEYINDMDICMAAADLVICRSGATTISELQALGKPSILIPSPIVAGNHQLYNANVLGKVGAAVVIEQKNVKSNDIVEIVDDFYKNTDKLKNMSAHALKTSPKNVEENIWGAIKDAIKK